MVLVALVVLIALTPAYEAISATANSRIGAQIIAGCIGVLGAASTIVIFLGMLAYLFLLDRSSSRLLWLIVFLFTGSFGSSIYFFAVYRKQIHARAMSGHV